MCIPLFRHTYYEPVNHHEYFQNLSKGSKEINVYSRMKFMCKRDVLIHVISKQMMWPSGAWLPANACPNVSTGDSQRLKSVLCSACSCRLPAECTTQKLSLNGWQCLTHVIWPVIGHWPTIYHEAQHRRNNFLIGRLCTSRLTYNSNIQCQFRKCLSFRLKVKVCSGAALINWLVINCYST